MDDYLEVKKKFKVRCGVFHQKYLSLRLPNKEITIDNFSGNYTLSLCTPYNPDIDKKIHHRGYGAGEVLKQAIFYCEDEIYRFLAKSNLV